MFSLTHELASIASKKWPTLRQSENARLSFSWWCCIRLAIIWLAIICLPFRTFVVLCLTLVSLLRLRSLISHSPLPRLVSTTISHPAFPTRLLALHCKKTPDNIGYFQYHLLTIIVHCREKLIRALVTVTQLHFATSYYHTSISWLSAFTDSLITFI